MLASKSLQLSICWRPFAYKDVLGLAGMEFSFWQPLWCCALDLWQAQCFWSTDSFEAFSCSPSVHPAQNLGVCTEWGGVAPGDERYSWPQDVTLSNKSWGKKEESRVNVWGCGVCFPKCYAMKLSLDEAVGDPPADGKQWMNSLFRSACTLRCFGLAF